MLWDLLALTGQLFLVMWLATAVFWGLAGAALAAALGRPLWQGLVLGAVLPGVGPVALFAVDLARSGRTTGPRLRTAAGWPVHGAREGTAVLALLAAVALVVVTGLRDTRLAVGSGAVSFTVRDLGLTTVTVTTVLVLAGAAVLSWRRPSRIAAVAVAWCASWWLLWALGALLVGDTLRVLADSAGFTGAVDASVTVGTSWTLLLGLAAVLLAWSAAVLLAGARPLPGAAPVPPAAPGLPAPRIAADPLAGPAAVPQDPFGPPRPGPGSGGW